MKVHITDIEPRKVDVTTKASGDDEYITRYNIKYYIKVRPGHILRGEYDTDDIDTTVRLEDKILLDIFK